MTQQVPYNPTEMYACAPQNTYKGIRAKGCKLKLKCPLRVDYINSCILIQWKTIKQ